MASNLEPSGAGSSLMARRSATSNLPSFELPPPPRLTQKYQSFSNLNSNAVNSQHAPATISVGNLLTPPTNNPGDSLSPISSGVNSVSPAAAQGLPPYTPNSYWPSQPGSGNTPYAYGTTATTPQGWQGPLNPLFPSAPRGLFSPSLGSLVRGSGSPAATEGLPPPPYDLNQLPPFPTSTTMSMSTPANLPALANQQTLTQTFMNVQPYPLPTINGSGMTGPIMSNVHSPGGQMAMIGTLPHGLPGGMMAGFNSGHSAQLQQMYGQQQTPHNERPFKCDQCPQSFNRNHDLKRHKRIHLAVKPFPCGHCEKSFSRKDALKVS